LSSSAGSVGAAATNTVACGAVCGPDPVVFPVDAVVGEAAAGLAVVFVVDAPAVVEEVSATDDVVLIWTVVVVVDSVGGGSACFAPPLPPQAPASVSAASATAIVLVPMSGRA